MNLIPLWAKALIAAALLAAAVFAWNAFLSHQQEIGYQKAVAEYAVKLAEAKDAALERERFLRTTVTEAQNERIKSETTLQVQLAAARSVSVSLRDDLADYRRSLATASVDAARAYADAGLRLLGACQERYIGVAAAAKGHLADSLMYQQAWPKGRF